jgi:tetratricopeptide (TPR) repeat protein
VSSTETEPAEFRAAVAVPLTALVVVLGFRSSPWWLLVLVLPALLLLEAQHTARTAADVLAESVRARPALSAALDEVRQGPPQLREDWIEYAAANNYPGAVTHEAGELELRGDEDAAERLYRRAAALEFPPAMTWLAGRLHRRRDPEADEWYAKAEEAGETTATTIKGLRDSLTPAELRDLRDAYAKDAGAMIRIGRYFEDSEQPKLAADWYRQALTARHPQALAALTALLRKNNMDAVADQLEQEHLVTADSANADTDRRRGDATS